MSRWVRVSADIFEHEFFARSEMSEREAFLWLVAKAAWKDTRHRIGSEMVPVPRGSLFATLRELCSAWGWKSDHKVRTFLDALEREGMIDKCAGAGKTRLTVCNYDKYQSPSQAEGASAAQDGRNEGALKIPEYQDTKEDTSLRSVSGASAPATPPIETDKPKSEKRASRLPDDFRPNDVGVKSANTAGMGADFGRELSRFADYHRAKGSKMVDWQAAWRTWCGNYRPSPRAGPSPRSTADDFLAAELRKFRNDNPNDDFSGITIDARAG